MAYTAIMASDTELLERWRAGERAAGTLLFERYYHQVERFFANKVSDTASEIRDFVQETFLALVQHRDRVEAGKFRQYLFAVAYKRFCSDLRRHYRSGGAAVAPPERDPLASEMDKAHVFSALFGGAVTTFKIDRFTLLSRIGGSAMGEVYVAYDERLERKVAIKLVRRYGDGAAPVRDMAPPESASAVALESEPSVAHSPELGPQSVPGSGAEAELLREAKIMAQISDNHVVRVYDAGVCDGRVYIAMEYIRGTTLRQWVAKLNGANAGTGAADRVDADADADSGASADTGTKASANASIDAGARQRQILRQFIAAGRGLAAAHATGLVHRDFKPDNVLVGADGQPRVGDFGLARPVADAVGGGGVGNGNGDAGDGRVAASRRHGDSGWAERPRWIATRTGRVMGTPRYMAPEQWRGHEPDHRSDQFSFCVALWEALAGQPPFVANTAQGLQRAIVDGALASPAAGTMAAPVREALERGLAADPAARFADMAALLMALDAADRHRQRRRRQWALGVGALTFAALLYMAVMPTPTAAGPCDDAGQAMEAVWHDAQRAAFVGTFTDDQASTAVPGRSSTMASGASPLRTAAAAELDRYAGAWQRARIDACEATHVRYSQSTELLDRRMICLDRGLARVRALVAEVPPAGASSAGGNELDGLMRAVAELPGVAACGDGASLRYGLQAPPAAIAEAVATIRGQLARARTLELLGRREQALVLAQVQHQAAMALGRGTGYGRGPVTDRGNTIVSGGYRPLQAEALFQLGRLLTLRGTDAEVARGVAMIHEAVHVATGERHDELAAEALAFLLASAYLHHDRANGTGTEPGSESVAGGHALAARAYAASRRIGDRGRDRAELLRRHGRLWALQRVYDRAEDLQRQGLALLAQGAGDMDIPWLYRAVHLHDLANTVRDRGRYQEAAALYREAHGLYARLGDDHVYLAGVRFDEAVMALRQGRLDKAELLLSAVLSVRQRGLGTMHPDVGAVHWALADVAQRRGQLQAAESAAAAGLRVYQGAFAADDARLVAKYQLIGAMRYRRGNYAGARDDYQRALGGLVARLGDRRHPEVGYARANLAEALLMLGAHERALAEIVAAADILFDVADVAASDRLMAAFLYGVRGRALLGLGRAAEAVAALEQALGHFDAGHRNAYDDDGGGGGAPLERAAIHWALARALTAAAGGRTSSAAEPARAQAQAALALLESAGAGAGDDAAAIRRWLGQRAQRR